MEKESKRFGDESRLSALESLFTDLNVADGRQAKEVFTELFCRGAALLGYDDDDVARALDTSRRAAHRWRYEGAVPAAPAIVLGLLRRDVEVEILHLYRRRYETLLGRAVRAERVLEELRRDVADIRSRGVAAQGTADVIEAAIDSAERRSGGWTLRGSND